MRIFFTVSRTGMKTKRYLSIYKKVLNEIKGYNFDVESTIEKTYLNEKPELKRVKALSEREDTYKYVHDSAVRKAIYRCDGMIIEASYPSFRLGFETFFALSLQKPVLVLSTFHNYAGLISQPHFFGAKYTDFTLPDEIERFFEHVKKNKLRNRFNLFISDKQKEQLGKSSKLYGVSMSDYIRSLIEKDKGLLNYR